MKISLKTLAEWIKSVAVIWAGIAATMAWVGSQLSDCSDCLELYKVEIALALMTLAGLAVMWTVTHSRFVKIEMQLRKADQIRIKGEIDRLFRELRHDAILSEDDAKYLTVLKNEMIDLGVNSFTQRKVDYLLAKDIA